MFQQCVRRYHTTKESLFIETFHCMHEIDKLARIIATLFFNGNNYIDFYIYSYEKTFKLQQHASHKHSTTRAWHKCDVNLREVYPLTNPLVCIASWFRL